MEKRNTVQKKFVLDAVNKLANHPTAEAVYTEVVKKHPSVSKATVYRNLSGLAQSGAIRHIPTDNGADRFDHNSCHDHNHIRCSVCGAFEDAPLIESNNLDDLISEKTGFKCVTHEIVYSGICKNCTKSIN